MKLQKLNIYLCEAIGNLYRSSGHTGITTGWGEGCEATRVLQALAFFICQSQGCTLGIFVNLCLFVCSYDFGQIFGQIRAHPFYIYIHIRRNQKSLLLIKTYFTARFCSPHSISKWKCKFNRKTKGNEKPENTKYRQDKPLRNDHSSVNNYSRFEVFAFPSFSLFHSLLFSINFSFLLINIQLVKMNALSAELSSVECRLSYS